MIKRATYNRAVVSGLIVAAAIFIMLAGCAPAGKQEVESTSIPVEKTQPITSQESANVIAETEKSEMELENDPAANADVLFVRAVQADNGSWTFHVTISHPDTGWEDYADGWDVITQEGLILKRNTSDPFTRLLLHPHENEQPFTRSQNNIIVPGGITTVIVRAHDIVDGFGGKEVIVNLLTPSGIEFEVE